MEIPLNPSMYFNSMFICSFLYYCFQRNSGTPSPLFTSSAGEEPPVRPHPLSACTRIGGSLPRQKNHLTAPSMANYIPGQGRGPRAVHPRWASVRESGDVFPCAEGNHHAHTSHHPTTYHSFISLFFLFVSLSCVTITLSDHHYFLQLLLLPAPLYFTSHY